MDSAEREVEELELVGKALEKLAEEVAVWEVPRPLLLVRELPQELLVTEAVSEPVLEWLQSDHLVQPMEMVLDLDQDGDIVI